MALSNQDPAYLASLLSFLFARLSLLEAKATYSPPSSISIANSRVDFHMGKQLGLIAIAPLDREGKFTEGFGEFTGRKATDADTVDLVLERRDGTPPAERPALTELGPWFDVCRPGCCENVRAGFKPAVSGVAP